MKTIIPLVCVIALVAGCTHPSTNRVPAKAALLTAASANGKYSATIERYDPNERIASVRTPKWQPENKPYQFDGKNWIPLWSPYAPELKLETK